MAEVLDRCVEMGLDALNAVDQPGAWLDCPTTHAQISCARNMIAGVTWGIDLDRTYAQTDATAEHRKWSLDGPALHFKNTVVFGTWAASGFPVVRMGHKTAALLSATSIGREDAEAVIQPPWPAFCVVLPTPLLTLTDPFTRERAPITLATIACIRRPNDAAFVARPPRLWFLVLSSVLPNGYINSVNSGGLTSADLAGKSSSGLGEMALAAIDGTSEHWGSLDATQDGRNVQLAVNLLVGCCLHLSRDPQHAHLRETMHRRDRTVARRGFVGVSSTDVQLQSSVKIDLSRLLSDVRSFAAESESGGKHRPSSVRTLVCGHWKRQPVGPDRSQRKLIHVLPYWRGLETALTTMRTK